MPKKEKAKQPKPGYTICTDCGGEYKIGMPHMAFVQPRLATNVAPRSRT